MAGENAREMEKENARGQYEKKHIERGISEKERCAWDGGVGVRTDETELAFFVVNHDIVRFDIAVHYPVAVRKFECY